MSETSRCVANEFVKSATSKQLFPQQIGCRSINIVRNSYAVVYARLLTVRYYVTGKVTTVLWGTYRMELESDHDVTAVANLLHYAHVAVRHSGQLTRKPT